MNNFLSEVLKMYEWLEEQSPNKDNVPFFSTNYISWVRLPDDIWKLDSHTKYEKRPTLTGDFYIDDNLLEINPIWSIPSEEHIEAIEALGVEVKIQ